MGLNSQAKAMIDRMQPFWAKKYILHLPVVPANSISNRKGLFISTAGSKGGGVFTCAQRSTQLFFRMLKIQTVKECLFSGIDQAGEIKNHPSALQEVRNAVLDLLS